MVHGSVTVDASVFLSAHNIAEAGQAESLHFLQLLGASTQPVVLPTLVIPEVGASAYRISGNAEIAQSIALSIAEIPGVIFVPLNEQMAEESMEMALESALKGGDAVYAATARRFGATLVTLDQQQRNRLPQDVRALYPGEALQDSE